MYEIKNGVLRTPQATKEEVMNNPKNLVTVETIEGLGSYKNTVQIIDTIVDVQPNTLYWADGSLVNNLGQIRILQSALQQGEYFDVVNVTESIADIGVIYGSGVTTKGAVTTAVKRSHGLVRFSNVGDNSYISHTVEVGSLFVPWTSVGAPNGVVATNNMGCPTTLCSKEMLMEDDTNLATIEVVKALSGVKMYDQPNLAIDGTNGNYFVCTTSSNQSRSEEHTSELQSR